MTRADLSAIPSFYHAHIKTQTGCREYNCGQWRKCFISIWKTCCLTLGTHQLPHPGFFLYSPVCNLKIITLGPKERLVNRVWLLSRLYWPPMSWIGGDCVCVCVCFERHGERPIHWWPCHCQIHSHYVLTFRTQVHTHTKTHTHTNTHTPRHFHTDTQTPLLWMSGHNESGYDLDR